MIPNMSQPIHHDVYPDLILRLVHYYCRRRQAQHGWAFNAIGRIYQPNGICACDCRYYTTTMHYYHYHPPLLLTPPGQRQRQRLVSSSTTYIPGIIK
jgi:hypothetical protein